MNQGPPEIPPRHSEPSEDEFVRFLARYDQATRSGERTEQLESEARSRFGEQGQDVLDAFRWLAEMQNRTASDPTQAEPATIQQNSSTNAFQFGRFRVMERLGVGGSGVVFRVYDPELAREAALKVPRGDILWEPERERRFRQEARAAALLDHPQIVPIYEAGKIGTINYILSEYCPGPNLAQWIAEQRLHARATSFRLAAQWMALLADAIDYAHRAGVVHRDLKPGNVLLEPIQSRSSTYLAEEAFLPKITDFGLAKFAMEVSSLTRTGTVLGTLPYLAPEQVQGRVQQATPALDIYSLGAVLYEFLGGRPPLVGEDELDLLRKVGVEEPPPLRTLRGDVPHDLEAICLKCLEWNPARRYASAADLKLDLERFLRGEPVVARNIGKPRRLWRKFVRSRTPGWTLAIAAVLLLSLVIGTGVYIRQATRNETHLSGTIQEFSKTKTQLEDMVSVQRGHIEQGYAADMRRASRLWSESTSLGRDNGRTAVEMKELLIRHVPVDTRVDPRGFEWNYLWRLCEPDRFARPLRPLGEFIGHSGNVYQVMFSRSGKTLITSAADKTVRFWDVATQQPLKTLVGHTDEINGFSLSTDEKLIVTASDDWTVRVWNCETGRQQQILTGHSDKVVGVAFDLSSRQILSGDNSGVVKLWDLDQGGEVLSFQAHDSRIQSVFRSPAGRSMAPGPTEFLTASADYTVKKWGLLSSTSVNPKPLRELSFNGPVEFCRPTGPLIFALNRPMNTGTYKSSVTVLWDGQPHRISYDTQDTLHAGLIEATQTQAVLAGRNCPISVLDFGTGKHWDITPESRFVWSMDLSPDGRYLATGEQGGRLMLWDHSVTPHYTLLPGAGDSTNLLKFSPNGRWLAAGTHRACGGPIPIEASLILWDLQYDQPTAHDLSKVEEGVLCGHVACFSPDGQRLAVASCSPNERWQCRVYSLSDVELICEWPLSDHPLIHLGFSSDGSRLRSVQHLEDRLQVISYKADSGEQATIVDIPGEFDKSINDEHFKSGNGNLLALRERDAVAIYDLAAEGLVAASAKFRIPIPYEQVTSIAFEPDAGLLAVGGLQELVQIFRCSDGVELGHFKLGGHAAVNSLAFGPGGNRLIVIPASSTHNPPELWSLQEPITKLCALNMPYFAEGNLRAAFSPAGKSVAASFWYARRHGDVPSTADLQDQTAVMLWRTTGREAPPIARRP